MKEEAKVLPRPSRPARSPARSPLASLASPGTWWHLLRRLPYLTYVDVGPPEATIMISGMGRSGTTWAAGMVNHRFDHRVVFEPFRPDVVPLASAFGPFAYMRRDARDDTRARAARSILSGHTPRGRVDRGHRGVVFSRRIVKEVRTNLILGWLRALLPSMPIVLIVRNPFAVAASWLRLGWGATTDRSTSELDVITAQPHLLDDFPVARNALACVDRSSAFERVVAQWCLLHLVPATQLGPADAHVVFYEDLMRDPEPTFHRLAEYLQLTVDAARLDRALRAPAETDFLARNARHNRDYLLTDWESYLCREQISRGRQILAAFGLDATYDEHGMPTGLALGASAAHHGTP